MTLWPARYLDLRQGPGNCGSSASMHAKGGIRFRQSSFSAQFKIVATGPQGAQAEARRKIRKTTVLELLDSIDALDCVGARDSVPIAVHLRFARMGAIVAMRVENYHPRGKPWWIRLDEKGGKSHECTRVTFSKRVSTSTSRPPKSATKAGPLFCRHRRADRAPKHSADAWRMIQLGAADIGSRVPADPRAPPPTAQANIRPISAPRVDSSQSPRHDDNAREPIATRTTALPILTQIKSLQSNRPYEFQFGGTSPRKTCSAHQSEAHHEKTNDHLQTSRNCL